MTPEPRRRDLPPDWTCENQMSIDDLLASSEPTPKPTPEPTSEPDSEDPS